MSIYKDIPKYDRYSAVSMMGHIFNHYEGEGIYRMPNNQQYYAYIHNEELIIRSLKWYSY